jgi:transposase
MAPVVEAYQAMRGASFLVAVTFAAEIGDVRRFDTPRQLTSFLGLVPAESSTGDTIRRKGLTLAGNGAPGERSSRLPGPIVTQQGSARP